jgi:hypothetical protein
MKLIQHKKKLYKRIFNSVKIYTEVRKLHKEYVDINNQTFTEICNSFTINSVRENGKSILDGDNR